MIFILTASYKELGTPSLLGSCILSLKYKNHLSDTGYHNNELLDLSTHLLNHCKKWAVFKLPLGTVSVKSEPKMPGPRAFLILLGRRRRMSPSHPSASSLCFRQPFHLAMFKSKIYRIMSREIQISWRKLEDPLFPRNYGIDWNLLRSEYEPRTGFKKGCKEG